MFVRIWSKIGPARFTFGVPLAYVLIVLIFSAFIARKGLRVIKNRSAFPIESGRSHFVPENSVGACICDRGRTHAGEESILSKESSI
jgi:hypothetical protein